MIRPYVMPHAPGNTDRDLMLGFWTAIIHGARAVDVFRVGPEQINTENYISSTDLDRYRTIRQMLACWGRRRTHSWMAKRVPRRSHWFSRKAPTAGRR